MALVSAPGAPIWFPQPPLYGYGSSMSTTLTIDATGEKIAMIGPFYSPDRSSKTINKVGFPTGAITSAGGSIIRVSLQNVSTTTGAPCQPDGTQDQYRDANLNTYTANSWFNTGLVTSDGTDTGSKRTVSHGELIAVVVEYDSGGRLGSDSLVVTSMANLQSTTFIGANTVLYTASWAIQNLLPMVIFECSDGSFASLIASYPIKSLTFTAFSSSSTPDEYGLKFTAPFNGTIEGIWSVMNTNSINVDFVLYKDGTEIASIVIDGNTISSANNHRMVTALFSSSQVLTKDSEYIIAVRPPTTSNVTIRQWDVDTASHWATHAGPAAMCQTSRTNAGSWSDTTTRRISAGLLLSEIHDGVSSGGGGPLIGGRLAR